MILKLILLIVILAQTTQAFAQCTKVDLNTTAPLKDMAILDQDGVGLCYAYAAAQMLEYHLRLKGHKITPSALDISLKSAGFFTTQLEGGNVEPIIDEIAESGVVEKSCIEKQIRSYTKHQKITIEEYTKLLHVMYENSSLLSLEKTELASAKKAAKESGWLDNCKSDALLDDLFKSGKWGDSVTSILEKVLNPCESKRKKIPKMTYDYVEYGNDKKMLNKLDSIIGKKKPASIALCAEALDGSHTGLKGYSPPFKRGSNGNINECGGHQVMVVGRRPSGGKCQYLIRNSWGSAWDSSSNRCACKLGKKYHEVCPSFKDVLAKKVNYEEYVARVYVGCWVDGANLGRNLLEVGSLK